METPDGLRNEELEALIPNRKLDNEVARLGFEHSIQPPHQTIHLEVCDLSQAIFYLLITGQDERLLSSAMCIFQDSICSDMTIFS